MRSRLLLGVLLIAVSVPATANARVPGLDRNAASAQATLELFDFASHKCHIQPEGCDMALPDPVSKYDCRRLSARAVSCPATVQLIPIGDALFPDQCEATVKVTRRGLFRFSTKMTRWECF